MSALKTAFFAIRVDVEKAKSAFAVRQLYLCFSRSYCVLINRFFIRENVPNIFHKGLIPIASMEK